MIETARLILRRWREEDREPFAAISADPRVGEWLGGVRTRAESDAIVEGFEAHIEQRGFGFWAAWAKPERRLIGMIGLRRLGVEDSPVGPAVEMGWRLASDAWGRGYATEGAKAVLDWGFANLKEPEIIAFTAATNLRSQAVMRRIGMRPAPERNFEHPKLPVGHPLRPHVVFVAGRGG